MKRFLASLLAICMVLSLGNFTVFAADNDVVITVTPSISSKVTAEAVDVIYTVKVTPQSGKPVGGFSFVFDVPENMTLATNKLANGYANQGGDGYWVAAKDLKLTEDEDTGDLTGIFETFEYVSGEKMFNAVGTTETRNLSSEAVIMTIKATIAAGKAGEYTLGLKNVEVLDYTGKVEGIYQNVEIVTSPVVITVPHVHSGTYHAPVEASCTAGGNVAYWSCDECGKNFADAACTSELTKVDTDKIPHDFASATCTLPKTCSVCGATEGEALGHDWDNATCTLPKTCSVCGATEGAALGHTWDNATCTLPKTCSVCGATEGEALGHNIGDTWLQSGTHHWKECTVCGEKDSYATHVESTPASCTAPAYCAVCDHHYGNKTEHVYGSDWTYDGSQHWHKCNTCDDKKDAAKHDEGATIDNKCDTCGAILCAHDGEKTTHPAAESTCLKQGNNEYVTCNKCNAVISGSAEKLPLADHKGGTASDCQTKAICDVCSQPYGEFGAHDMTATIAKTETCTEDGNSAYWTCGTCGKYYSDAEGKQEIAKDSWVIAKHHTLTKIPGKAANCTETGKVDTWECDGTCGKTYIDEAATTEATETNVVIAIIPDAHNWVDGVCQNNNNHRQTVTEVEPGTKVEVEIPEDIKTAIETIKTYVITVKEIAEEIKEIISDNWNTLFKDGSVEVVEGKLVYELLPDAPEGEYNIEITVGEGEDAVVYVVNVVVAEENRVVDRPDRPSYNSSAVKKVIEMIDELPSAKKVTLDDEEDIEAARKAYEKLSKSDKAKVTNYEDLVEVEEALEALKKAEEETPVVTTNPFVDVDEDAYYADSVLWAVANNITSGTSAVTFSPDAVCTRAQVVTFLWRAAGCPAPLTSDMPFVDVEAGAYYAAAVQWAVENNITAGTSATTFDPNGKCTRGQIVTFLWRAQGNPAAAAVNNFVDVEDGAYYNAPVLWAVANGITNGTSATTFSPAADCTRAQVVTFIYRCMAE